MKNPQDTLIAGGLIVGFLLLAYLLATQHTSQSLLVGIALLLGYTLFHARFGFTGAFRRMMSVGNGQVMRSHMLMLAVAVTLFALFWRVRDEFNWKDWIIAVAGLAAGLPIGIHLFGAGDEGSTLNGDTGRHDDQRGGDFAAAPD